MNQNSSTYSNDSTDYSVKVETLDVVFKNQLPILRELVYRQTDISTIELCSKWLRVFSKTSTSEKFARNCLCSLMQEQLQEFGFLVEPFINLQNCNRDLELVLTEIDELSTNRQVQSPIKFPPPPSTEMSSPRPVPVPVPVSVPVPVPPPISLPTPPPVPGIDTSTAAMNNQGNNITECRENELNTENSRLRHEMELLRLQLTDQQIENARLREVMEKQQISMKNSANSVEHYKKVITESMLDYLSDLEKHQDTLEFKVLQNVLNVMQNDLEFSAAVKNFDTRFEDMLNSIFRKELHSRKVLIAREVTNKLRRSKVKLRKKYEKRLGVQNWAQRLQLKLVKLKCLSVVRQIFIDTHKDGCNADGSMWQMLKILEEKYESVVNEIS